jgi:hypothetical protein
MVGPPSGYKQTRGGLSFLRRKGFMFNDPAHIFVFGMVAGFVVLIIFVKINSDQVEKEEKEKKDKILADNKKKS